jgi:hypothetical protein
VVAEIVPGCRIEYAKDAGPDTRCYRVDFSRAAQELPGFRQQWTAKRGAEEMYEAYVANDIQIEDVEGIRYNRIDHIKHLLAEGVINEGLRFREEHVRGQGNA